jgi:selenide,water dikinase
MSDIKLTAYSHGAGCGCKISPSVLDKILSGKTTHTDFADLLVGNGTRDDAAVYDIGNGMGLISTTDFFMPIVDDPYDFGRIAAANAISDVYAMGGKPLLAIAILGWPVNTLPPDIAGKVVEGGRSMCLEAGIPLAGGHSIDSPEPIFGLAVNGIVKTSCLKRNDTARLGDQLFLTKSIGVGILTTAEKKGLLSTQHQELASHQMMLLNKVGTVLSEIEAVHAMTDVTGFGLLGHLTEMADGSSLSSELYFDRIPLLTPDLYDYIMKGAVPGGTTRNLSSYGDRISFNKKNSTLEASLLADPQTSGGLLISVGTEGVDDIRRIFHENGLDSFIRPIGMMVERKGSSVYVS